MLPISRNAIIGSLLLLWATLGCLIAPSAYAGIGLYGNISRETSMAIQYFSCSAEFRSGFVTCGNPKNIQAHHDFVEAMKIKNTSVAIKAIENMSSSVDGLPLDPYASNYYTNKIDEKIFGTVLAPGEEAIMPPSILAIKGYKGGLLLLTGCLQSGFACNGSQVYVTFMRAKKTERNTVDTIVVYNVPLVSEGSKQDSAYRKLYGNDYNGDTYFQDLMNSFRKGKFNNKDVNKIYQDLIRSIK